MAKKAKKRRYSRTAGKDVETEMKRLQEGHGQERSRREGR